MKEKQILLNTGVLECFHMYADFWQPNLIKRHEFLEANIDRNLLLQEYKNYSVIYKQEDITYIPLVSRHRNLPHISTIKLSEILDITVIYYAEWEDVVLEVCTSGHQEFVTNIDLNGRLSVNSKYSDRFFEMHSNLQSSHDYKMILGNEMENVWNLLKIPSLSQQQPNSLTIEEAISFEFYGNWKENKSL